jgi:hypothetical protein
MLDPQEFADIADHILNTVVTTYADHGISLPERRYLAVGGQGSTVHDCEQVTVSFEQGYSGRPGAQAQEPVKCNSLRTGVYVIEVVRALPIRQPQCRPVLGRSPPELKSFLPTFRAPMHESKWWMPWCFWMPESEPVRPL